MAAVIPVGQSGGWLFIPASQVLTRRVSVLLNSVHPFFILNISLYIFFFHYMIVIVSDFV